MSTIRMCHCRHCSAAFEADVSGRPPEYCPSPRTCRRDAANKRRRKQPPEPIHNETRYQGFRYKDNVGLVEITCKCGYALYMAEERIRNASFCAILCTECESYYKRKGRSI